MEGKLSLLLKAQESSFKFSAIQLFVVKFKAKKIANGTVLQCCVIKKNTLDSSTSWYHQIQKDPKSHLVTILAWNTDYSETGNAAVGKQLLQPSLKINA